MDVDVYKRQGFYQLIEFNADPTVIDKLEVNFRRDERVIRFLTFKMDKYAAEYAATRRSVKMCIRDSYITLFSNTALNVVFPPINT